MCLFDLSGSVAIVTGCNTGIGQSLAIGLAEAGADIAGVYHSTESMLTKSKITSLGRNFFGIKADISLADDRKRIIESVINQFGHFEILVNNAGINIRNEAINFTEEEWDSVMNVNAKALFFLSQDAAKQFIRQGKGGKIINIASMLSFQGGIRVSAYTASKSAVVGITKILANEWARKNINVNAIAPGYMLTKMTKPTQEDEIRNRDILARIPVGKWGDPDDVKGAAIFLASSASQYVHGITIPVDGGWLAR